MTGVEPDWSGFDWNRKIANRTGVEKIILNWGESGVDSKSDWTDVSSKGTGLELRFSPKN